MRSVSSGYADVNGIKLYHEIYGQGEPLVQVHGGLTTIGEMQGWVQPRRGSCLITELARHQKQPSLGAAAARLTPKE
jgi:hypothetical protein